MIENPTPDYISFRIQIDTVGFALRIILRNSVNETLVLINSDKTLFDFFMHQYKFDNTPKTTPDGKE
jgi:hypothetical protein